MDSATTILDVETGEVLCTFMPGDPKDVPALAKALAEVKKRLGDLMATKRAIEHAIVSACPTGFRSPEWRLDVEINLGQDDAKRLVQHGFGFCVSLSESVKFRLLKTELRKLEKLDAEKFGELMELLQNCTRSVRISETSFSQAPQGAADLEAMEEEP